MTDRAADTDRLAAVAERAVRAGGDHLRETFRDGPITAEYGTDDVNAAADRAAERRIVDVIRAAYPDHGIRTEESEDVDGGPYEWVVDPLDGTNNFAAGVPMFASAVCVRRGDRPVTAAIHEPLPDCLYLARRDGGATADGEPISADSDVSLPTGTVSFVIGLAALRDPARRTVADRIESAVDAECKRVLNTWSPCVDWGLLARGGTEGLVAYCPDVYEQYAGELLAAEAGVRYRVLDPETGGVASDGSHRSRETGTTAEGAVTGVGRLYVGATDADNLDTLTDAVRAAVSSSS
jgi:myo-inositol-1(or 4)-monophosphatase